MLQAVVHPLRLTVPENRTDMKDKSFA